jgi:hypothetical protein
MTQMTNLQILEAATEAIKLLRAIAAVQRQEQAVKVRFIERAATRARRADPFAIGQLEGNEGRYLRNPCYGINTNPAPRTT